MPTLEEIQAKISKGPEGAPPLGQLGTETVGQTPEGRPIIKNLDGSYSTERSITVRHPSINEGRWTNIPSIYGGREVSEPEAIRIISEAGGIDPETKRPLPGYASMDEAIAAAKQRSSQIKSPSQAPTLEDIKRRLNRAGYVPIPGPINVLPKASQFGAAADVQARNIRGGAAELAADLMSEAGVLPETEQSIRGFAEREAGKAERSGELLRIRDFRDIKNWEDFSDWLKQGAGSAAVQLPYFASATLAGGLPGGFAAAVPMGYQEIRQASQGIDPTAKYNIPGTDIRMTGRQMQLLGSIPHAMVEMAGLQRYLGGNSNFFSSLVQELGEEAVQHLVAEMVAEAQRNEDLDPFIRESLSKENFKEAGAQVVNAIPQVTFMMGMAGAAQKLAARATPDTPTEPAPAPATAATPAPEAPTIPEPEATAEPPTEQPTPSGATETAPETRPLEDILDEIEQEVEGAPEIARETPETPQVSETKAPEIAPSLEQIEHRIRESERRGVPKGKPATVGPVYIKPITAFHGTPHDFERFDIGQIGAGEGAQAYGHGLYFAESPGVAESYQERLGDLGVEFNDPSSGVRLQLDHKWQQQLNDLINKADPNAPPTASNKIERAVIEAGRNNTNPLEEFDAAAQRWKVGAERGGQPDSIQTYEDASNTKIRKILETLDPKRTTSGRLYEVSINARPDEFLDWDKPLTQQNKNTQDAVMDVLRDVRRRYEESAMNTFPPGSWGALQEIKDTPLSLENFNVQQAAAAVGSENFSSEMTKRGIKGIRYLDQGSRAEGKGTYNYVVFDDSIVQITKKDGKPVSPKERREYIQHIIRESERTGVPEGRPAERGPVYPVHKVDKRTIRGRPRVSKKPLTLAEFLAKKGGVQDVTGELKGMDAHLWHKEKPFRSMLVRDKGMDPDKAREAAAEAGYLPTDTTVADFYDALDQDLRAGMETVEDIKARNRDAMEQEASYIGVDPTGLSDDRLANAIIMKRAEAGAEPDEYAGVRDLYRERMAEQYRDWKGQPAVDETDQGAQTVIPGAERISDRELAERGMEGRKTTDKPQKDPGEGLFDVAGRGQADLLERAKEPTERSIPGFDENIARQAYAAVSFNPEKRAEQDRQSFESNVRSLEESLAKIAQTDEQKRIATEQVERYRTGYLKKYNAWAGASSRTMSAMITGPANFPTRRNEKRLATERKRMGEFVEWEKKARAASHKAVNDAASPEQKTAERRAEIKKRVIRGVASIASIDSGKSPGFDRSLFVSNLAGFIKRKSLEDARYALDQVEELQTKLLDDGTLKRPVFSPRHSIWKRREEAEPELSQVPETKEYTIGDVTVVENVEADRLQLFYPGKPDQETRSKLKARGFKWAPSQGAWQRQLTNNARHAAEQVLGQPITKEEPRIPGETKLYTFPGPLTDIVRPVTDAYQKRADQVLDTLAEGSRRIGLGGWPFRDAALSALPNRDEYLTERGLAKGRVFRVNEVARHFNDILRRGDKASQKAAFEFLTTKGADPKFIPDARVRNAAIAAKSTIKKTGRELVRRGLLSKESYQKHHDAYLPRVYLKHLMAGGEFGTGLRTSPMGYLKQRKDLDPELREIILGQVEDPGFLTAKAISLPARDMAILDFLRLVSQNPEWTLEQSLVEYRGGKVTPFWLKSEAERLRDQARRMEEPRAQRARDIAQDMDAVAEQGLQARGKVPDDYRELPDSPRYGELRGLVVRKEVFDDIVGAHKIWVGDRPLYDMAFAKAAEYNAFWKMMKVPLNPPTQVRNFISNSVLLNISGVDATKLPGLYIQALGEIRKNGKHARIAKRHGIQASTFTAEEIYKLRPDLLRVKGMKGGMMGKLHALAEPLSRATSKASDLYQFLETWGKVVKIIDEMNKGATENQAVLEANKALFDYSLVPGLVRSLRTQPIGAPFITFYYKAAPQVIESVIKRPGRLAPYIILPYVLSDVLIAALHDVNEDDVDKLREALPKWLRERGHTYIFPVKDETGRWVPLDYGYFLPWAVHWQTSKSLAQGKPGEMMTELGVLGGPVPQIMSAVTTGIDPWTERPIVNKNDPADKQAFDLVTYAWRMGAPTWLTDIGVAGHLYRTMTNTPNYYGDLPLSLPQAGARMVGVNVYPMDPVLSRQRNLRRMSFEIRDLQSRARSQLRNKSLSKDEREDLRKSYNAEIEKKKRELQDYQKASEVHPSLR